MSEHSQRRRLNNGDATLFAAATPARHTAERGPTARQGTQTSRDTSSPWPSDCALGGWSARMFCHTLLATSRPGWSYSDTERWLSDWMPLALHANPESGISLSAVLAPLGQASPASFRSVRMVRGLLRRVVKRARSLRVLLHDELATMPVIVTFGSQAEDCESWTVKNADALPASLVDGLLDYLKRCWRECTATQ